MEGVLRLVRLPMVILPLILWTLIWPVMFFGVLVIAVPLMLVGILIWRTICFPFVFLAAAFLNDPDRVPQYLRTWGLSLVGTMALPGEIKVARGYSTVLAWWDEPKAVEGIGWLIISGNILGALGIAAALSATVRFAITIILTIIGVLVVLSLFSSS